MKEDKRIIVYVSGGVVQDVYIPGTLDAFVEIRDYDIDGTDAYLEEDNDGKYVKSLCFPNKTS